MEQPGLHVEDAALAQRAAIFLYTRGLCGADQVVVKASAGTVILCGEVPSPETKRDCLECCRNVAGVIRVVDELEIAARRGRTVPPRAPAEPRTGSHGSWPVTSEPHVDGCGRELDMAITPHTDRADAAPHLSAPPVTINPAFFEEAKEVYLEISAKLKHLAELGRQTSWTEDRCQELATQLQEFRDLLELSFALEEAYGYFENPVFVAAGYSRRVNRLRGEHEDLYAKLDNLVEHATRSLDNGTLKASARTICARFRDFCQQFEQHERRERDLITEAYTLDIGCLD
jgi:hypothetical protein